MNKCIFWGLITIAIFCRAQNKCVFENQNGKIQKIQISDRTLFTQFATHLRGQQRLVFAKMNTETKSEAVADLRELLKEHSQTISDAKTNKLELEVLLWGQKVQWLGDESTEDEAKAGYSLDKAVSDCKKTSDELKHLELTGAEVDSLLYLLCAPLIILKLNRPELFRQLKHVPIDDNVAKARSEEIVRKLMISRDDLSSMRFYPPELALEQYREILSIKNQALQSNTMIPQIVITRQIELAPSSEAKKEIETYFNLVNEFLELSKKRDEATAEKSFRQSGNGLIIMGSAHGPGISQRLTALCNGGEAVPISSPSPSGAR